MTGFHTFVLFLAAALVVAITPGPGIFYIVARTHLRLRKPRAVDDAGVVELVADDEIFFAEDGADRSGVRGESTLEDHAGFHVLEESDLFLKLHVQLHGACDGADCSWADAEFFRRGDRSLDELRVIAQPQIIVRR